PLPRALDEGSKSATALSRPFFRFRFYFRLSILIVGRKAEAFQALVLAREATYRDSTSLSTGLSKKLDKSALPNNQKGQ
ncbi:hypothetical protein LWX53_11785, partial [bacterium]|nr:hypothetical protein [bacterium]